jgi:hypothetical protein
MRNIPANYREKKEFKGLLMTGMILWHMLTGVAETRLCACATYRPTTRRRRSFQGTAYDRYNLVARVWTELV